jgi:hypothetical protein
MDIYGYVPVSECFFSNLFPYKMCTRSHISDPFVGFWQVGSMNHLMGAGGPHWCEDPVVDRENQVGYVEQ